MIPAESTKLFKESPMLRRMFVPLLMLAFVVAIPAAQQAGGQLPPEKVDTAMNAKIRAEGFDRSQIMRIVHVLTDVYGPRLTGSPNFDNSAKWAIKEMESWGMKGYLHSWDWAREGWLNEKASGHIISPVKDNLVFEVLAWTPSTNGTVTAPAVLLVTPTGPPAPAPPPDVAAGGRGGGPPAPLGPTEEELNAYFAKLAPKIKGAIVLVGESRVAGFVEVEGAKRRNDDQARQQYNPDPNAPPGAGRGGRGGRGDQPAAGGRGAQAAPPAGPARLSANQVNQRVAEFLLKNGAAVRVNDSGRRHQQIIAFSGGNYDAAKTLPTVVLSNEHYGRIARLLGDGTDVTLEFTIVNRTYPGKTSFNAIGEIPGSDKADEVVMLGGHLDSWHSSTGATDNAIGCAIMMEAARILRAVGAKPRRTIRVALWGGEEQGLLGSQAYVRDTFGFFEDTPRKPAYDKFSAYWNIDSGTGLVRGAGIFGPPEAAKVLAQFIKPWEEFKIYGATSTSSRNRGGTDSTSFNEAGLPGIGGGQDTIEYGSHTHHTNLDSYERILPDDVKKNAIITASIVYHIAMRDEIMPRFTKEQMPPRPGGRGAGGQ
jgi:Zn-dependent M28 family amino/carboxypeptidase